MERIKWIFRAWRYRLKLERQEILIVMNYLQAGDTVIDVGAHKGGYTYWMRRRVGSGGRVIGFEPQPELARNLKKLVNASGYDNVTIENKGISSASGTLLLQVPGTGTSPGATFEQIEATAPRQRIPIAVTTLDEYLADHATGQVSLIKCDAEGHELEVFKGAQGLLEKHHPLLIFECEARHRASGRVDDVFSFLRGLGYQGQALSQSGPFDLEKFDIEKHQDLESGGEYINNFLFRYQANS